MARYYSINGEGKYSISDKEKPDKNGMVNALDFHAKKMILVQKNLLQKWKSPVGSTQLRNPR